MIRGIRFHIPNKRSNFLKLIFDGFPIEDYHWRLLDMEAYVSTGNLTEKFLFDRDSYSGTELRERIAHDSYYIIFLGLLAFPCAPGRLFCTYQEFLDSDAVMYFHFIDCNEVTLYGKDPAHLEFFKRNAEKHGFYPVEWVDENNDGYEDWITAREWPPDSLD